MELTFTRSMAKTRLRSCYGGPCRKGERESSSSYSLTRRSRTIHASIRFVPLPKSATPARIHSNTKLYDWSLDEEDMAQLDALDKGKEGAVTWNPVDAE